MKKQFNLEYYLAHPETKVVTRDDHSVRIICTDAISEETYNIIGLVSCGSRESVYRFKNNGMYMDGCEHYYDLFFYFPDQEMKRVPLTYEDLLERVIAEKTMWVCINGIAINIIEFDREGVYYLGSKTEIYFNEYKRFADLDALFSDGDPFWKEVVE